MKNNNVYCRVAPSLGGGFAGSPYETWNIKPYNQEIDQDNPCVFFGMYGLPDFMALRQHKGKKWILWAGSDIRHFKNGYWIDDKGKYRINPRDLSGYLSEIENWVENQVEYEALKEFGIESKICPSFLGNIDDYPVSFTPSNKLYTSVSGDNFHLYGWDKIDKLAEENPHIEFHLYGNKTKWKTDKKNVIIHGRVSQKEMNDEIKNMAGALRLTEFEGFSEIIAKSILWGQYPVSVIEYPGVMPIAYIGLITKFKKPNLEARNYYLTYLNKYPWCDKI